MPFNLSDIQIPSGITAASSAQETLLFENWGDLESDRFNLGSASVPATDCLSTAIDALPYQYAGTTLSLSQTLQLAPCFTTLESNDSSSVLYTTATVQLTRQATCADGSLAKYNNQSAGQVDVAAPLNACLGAQSYLTEMKIVRSGTYTSTSSGSPVSGMLTHTSIYYRGQPDLSPCMGSTDGTNFTTQDSCVREELDILNLQPQGQPAQNNVSVQQAITSDLVESDPADSVWPSSGHFTVQLQNWTGTFTYTSAGTGPTYSLTSSTGQVLTGQDLSTSGTTLKK